MQKTHLTSIEAAEYLGYSKHTLGMSRSTGILAGVTAPKYIKAGRLVKYAVADLEDWLGQFEKLNNTGANND